MYTNVYIHFQKPHMFQFSIIRRWKKGEFSQKFVWTNEKLFELNDILNGIGHWPVSNDAFNCLIV